MNNFDYEGALAEGYTLDEINEFLSSQPKYTKLPGDFLGNIGANLSNFYESLTAKPQDQGPQINQKLLKKFPNFDLQGAIDEGYSVDEINDFLAENQPKRSAGAKAGRLATQFGISALQATPTGLAYEAAIGPLSSKEAQTVQYRKNLFDDIERLQEQKMTGIWDEKDQQLLDNLIDQVKNPEKMDEFVHEPVDIGIREIAEKVSGIDLEPEDWAEKAASWTGFIKNPTNAKELFKIGLKPTEVIKAIAPSGSEILRGIGAGAALEMAEQGNFGPIGTMASAVVGDIIGGGAGAVVKGGVKLATQPKKTMAEIVKKFTPKEKLDLQKEIIKDFRNSGLQADAGTLTDSNLIKYVQSRIAQSGLTGKALDDFKQELTDQVKREYKSVADGLGELKYTSAHETGEVLKNSISKIREADLAETRKFYQNAEKSLKEKAFVDSKRLASAIEKLEKQLKPGQLKSTEQNAVLSALEKIKRDIYDSTGSLLYADVKDLMNNKIALNDIINYEVQGGAKQLLKNIVGELDRSIISHGKENPTFAKNYIMANKRFSDHARTFRNKNVNQLLQADPSHVMNKMNTVQGIKDISKILSRSPDGKQILNNLKRSKLDEIVGNNLIDSTTKQAKLGTFSKLLEKGKNREIVKELLEPQAFKRLEKLQKNAGRLADAAQKFYNASKSGVVAADAAVIAKGLGDISNLLMGNPWPLFKTVGGVITVKKLSNLLADPIFLKFLEESILAADSGSAVQMNRSLRNLKPYFLLSKEDLSLPTDEFESSPNAPLL